MWKGSGRSLFQTLFLENFKFTLFVVTPLVTSSIFLYEPFMDYMIKDRQYVRYPPEGERPPTNEQELREAYAARKKGATRQ